MFYKSCNRKSSQYLFKLILEKQKHPYATRKVDNISFLTFDTTALNFFFPFTIIEWNNLDPTLWNSKSFVVFKNSILKFIRPFPSNVFDCDNHKSVRLTKSYKFLVQPLNPFKNVL